MRIKREITLLFTILITLNAWCALPKLLYPSKAEQMKMLEEADDYIDDMADGEQDLRADAVLHALRGMNGELENLRKREMSPSVNNNAVVKKDIKGSGAARGLKMRLYSPAKRSNKPLPLLVYFHAGGWTFGGLESGQRFCESLVASGKMSVLAVDYSLAPENPYPGALEDCEIALEYAFENASELGTASNLISAGGDSTGGNLALASAMYLNQKEGNKYSLRSLVLLYPVLRVYNDKSSSWKKYSKGYGLDGRLMEAYAQSYLFGKIDSDPLKDPLISPYHAEDNQIKNLPPILMISAERDILNDQGQEFTVRLQKLGRPIERIEFPGAVHLFATKEGQPTAFNKAVVLITTFLNL